MSTPSHELIQRLRDAKSITVITGAGMSAESGVPTFRDASTGFWAKFDAYALASPQGWKENHSRVWAWYEWRRGLVSRTQPHPGHFAITDLSNSVNARPDGKGKFTLITQNVDDLHERAGFSNALHVHGSLFEPRCSACGNPSDFQAEPPTEAIEHMDPPQCTRCGGYVRPGVVWFGESLPTRLWHQSVRAVQECDLLLVVGTSGVVHPIADLPHIAKESGAWVCEINPQATEITHVAHHSWRVSAAVGLPLLVSPYS